MQVFRGSSAILTQFVKRAIMWARFILQHQPSNSITTLFATPDSLAFVGVRQVSFRGGSTGFRALPGVFVLGGAVGLTQSPPELATPGLGSASRFPPGGSGFRGGHSRLFSPFSFWGNPRGPPPSVPESLEALRPRVVACGLCVVLDYLWGAWWGRVRMLGVCVYLRAG